MGAREGEREGIRERDREREMREQWKCEKLRIATETTGSNQII